MERIGTLAVIGVGLIGGSLALALKSKRAVDRVIGVGRSQANLDEALRLGVIDDTATVEQAARADVVFVATPVAQMPVIFALLSSRLGPRTVVTDGGSTKQDVIAAARAALGSRFNQFVPAHPIAGTEHTGAAAAFPTLYESRKVVICAGAETHADAVHRVATMWQATGAIIHRMSAVEHDDVFAAVSHLPHLLAFALVDMLAGMPRADQYFNYAASGFRDFTRIAAASPEMWRDVCLNNRAAIVEDLDAYLAHAQALRNQIAASDSEALLNEFTRASEKRLAWGKDKE